jgi:Superfamily I DNA and RNA helicases
LAGQAPRVVAELTIGYRVPSEVMDFAAPLAEIIAPTVTFPTSIRPASAGNPITVVETPPHVLLEEALARAAAIAAKDEERARSIAIVAPDDAVTIRTLEERLASSDLTGPAIRILAVSDVKGLEFDHVIVVEPGAIARQVPSGLRQLYVAITRCTQTLTLVHTQPLPAGLPAADSWCSPPLVVREEPAPAETRTTASTDEAPEEPPTPPAGADREVACAPADTG